MTDRDQSERSNLAGDLKELADLLPKDLGRWRGLIDQAAKHVEVVLGDKEKVAIVGPANAGKSTLYNKWIHSDEIKSPVSAIPGTTRETIAGDAGIFAAIDTPGADSAGSLGVEERERALSAAREADVLVALFDASHGIRNPEVELARRLMGLDAPVIVALNKIDLVPKAERSQVLASAAISLGISVENILAVSAKTGENVEQLLVRVALAEPGIMTALGAALPHYRWRLSQVVIGRAASSAAAIAVTPIPMLDFIPLVGVQAAMVMSLARIHTYRLNLARAKELLATFGAGVLGRTLFYELSKLSGPPGWLVGAAVAAGTTAAIGYASAVWFERGARLPAEAIKRISRETAATVVERLRDLGRRKPGRKSLRERIEAVLEDMPPSASTDSTRQSG